MSPLISNRHSTFFTRRITGVARSIHLLFVNWNRMWNHVKTLIKRNRATQCELTMHEVEIVGSELETVFFVWRRWPCDWGILSCSSVNRSFTFYLRSDCVLGFRFAVWNEKSLAFAATKSEIGQLALHSVIVVVVRGQRVTHICHHTDDGRR